MLRPILFLLKEDFETGDGQTYFCPDCATVSGILDYFPKIRHSIDIRYVDFPRPRREVVEMVGEANQGCPVLVLERAPPMQMLRYLSGQHEGRYYVSGAKAIAIFWANLFGTSKPR